MTIWRDGEGLDAISHVGPLTCSRGLPSITAEVPWKDGVAGSILAGGSI